MRAAIYARVSTKDQSCELQLRDLRTYCAARAFEAVREYVDVGVSGAKDSRPELNKLMDDARKRQFDSGGWRVLAVFARVRFGVELLFPQDDFAVADWLVIHP